MKIIYKLILFSMLLLTIVANPKKLEKQAKKFNCDPTQKISLDNKILAQCSCQDKSVCIWNSETGEKLTGCDCKPPTSKDYNCLEAAVINQCGDTKLECNTGFGQCQCPNGGQCAWIGKKSIGGCPCGNPRPPEFNFDQKEQKPKPPKKDKKKKENQETVEL